MNYANQQRFYMPLNGESELFYNEEKDPEGTQFLFSMKWEKLLDVMAVLNKSNEFVVWEYILKYRGKEYYEYSPADLKRRFGISETTCRRIRDKLVEYGFLVKVKNNTYKFIPYPQTLHSAAVIARANYAGVADLD